MQLNDIERRGGALHLALAAAAASLLSAVAAPAQAEGLKTDTAAAAPAASWQVDSAVLIYKEGDGRISAVEPVVAARRTDGNDRSWGLRLTLDALTGASPNGAVAQPTAQTFTSPSGKSRYTTAPGATPLNTSFRDTRIALAASNQRPWGEDQRVSLGGNVSVEHDFASLSASGNWARDFDNKNSTLSLGLSAEFDTIRPEGGVPRQGTALGLGSAEDDGGSGSATRRVVDVLAGWTQVMSRGWIVQATYNLGRGTGHHADPYKIVSVLDGSGLLTGDPYRYESRPDRRTRHSLYLQSKWHLERDVVDLAWRTYRDDWGIRSNTLDARYRWELGSGPYLEPHLRWYRQGAADFYRPWITAGVNDSERYASADNRLAAFTARTLGLKLGLPLSGGREFITRLEVYRQKVDEPAAPSALRGLDLVPDLKATTLMVGYSLPF